MCTPYFMCTPFMFQASTPFFSHNNKKFGTRKFIENKFVKLPVFIITAAFFINWFDYKLNDEGRRVAGGREHLRWYVFKRKRWNARRCLPSLSISDFFYCGKRRNDKRFYRFSKNNSLREFYQEPPYFALFGES